MFPFTRCFLQVTTSSGPHLPLHSPIALLVEHPSDRPLRRTRTSVLQATPTFGAKTGSAQHARKIWQTPTKKRATIENQINFYFYHFPLSAYIHICMCMQVCVCVYEYNSSGVCWPPSPTLVRANTQKYISNIHYICVN